MDHRSPPPPGRRPSPDGVVGHPWLLEQLRALGLSARRAPDLAGWRALLARVDEGCTSSERIAGARDGAREDELTGLPDRSALVHELDAALRSLIPPGTDDGRAATVGGVGVLYVDLDRFKLVNNSLGGSAADRLLVAVVDRLRGVLRTPDRLARVRADEFAVVLGGDVDAASVTVVGDRIVRALRRPFADGGEELHVTASVGSAWTSDPDAAPLALLRDAELAMHRAKEAGGDQHRAYDRTLREEVTSRVQLERRLRHALERDELSLAYQPIFRLADGRLAGFEALLRWHPADGPAIAPTEFVPIAEDTGLIVPLGAWVLDRAVREVAAWNRERADDPLRVSVNVSGRQLATPGLAGLVARSLHEHGLARGCLTLEMTESVLIAEPDRALVRLEVLRDLGARLSVDDFGTGYSSLAYLRRFPLDALKIDREFTRTLVDDAHGRTITQAIIALGHALGYDVVAEGVEDGRQLAALTDLGCDLVQGFLLGRPLDTSAARALALGEVAPPVVRDAADGSMGARVDRAADAPVVAVGPAVPDT